MSDLSPSLPSPRTEEPDGRLGELRGWDIITMSPFLSGMYFWTISSFAKMISANGDSFTVNSFLLTVS